MGQVDVLRGAGGLDDQGFSGRPGRGRGGET